MQDHELIRAWRRSMQMTQEEFGDLIGRSSRTVANYESGDHEIPNDKIAKMLGLTYEQYRGGPTDVFSKPIKKPTHYESVSHETRMHIQVPDTMIPIYCLSEINRSLMFTPYEGFIHPPMVLPNTRDFCRLIVDKPVSATNIPRRVIVNQQPLSDDEYFLIWDGKKADIVHQRKIKKESNILGSVIF